VADNLNRGMSKFQKERISPAVVSAAEAVALTRSTILAATDGVEGVEAIDAAKAAVAAVVMPVVVVRPPPAVVDVVGDGEGEVEVVVKKTRGRKKKVEKEVEKEV
jgi:hypothetical protein